MLADGLPDDETDHTPVDFATLAEETGLHAVRVTEASQLQSALDDTLCSPRLAFVDVVTDSDPLAIHPHVDFDEVRGFALAGSKLMLDGGVGRLYEMVRSNLREIPHPR